MVILGSNSNHCKQREQTHFLPWAEEGRALHLLELNTQLLWGFFILWVLA
jgi:hypothetical protein